MKEEFHRDSTGYKQLYGWGTIYPSVWLPSLIELVGIDPDKYNATNGTYYSAMQGLNASGNWYVDAQGGEQLAYFKQYNASGGGEKLWNACRQEETWLRSSTCWDTITTWRISNAQRLDTPACTVSRAVHPAAGDTNQLTN